MVGAGRKQDHIDTEPTVNAGTHAEEASVCGQAHVLTRTRKRRESHGVGQSTVQSTAVVRDGEGGDGTKGRLSEQAELLTRSRRHGREVCQ